MWRLAAFAGAAALVACGSPQRPAARSDTPRVATPRVAVLGSSTAPSTVTSAPTAAANVAPSALAAEFAAAHIDSAPLAAPGEVSAEVRAACEEAAATWATIPEARLRRGDSLVQPADAIGDSSRYWRDKGPRFNACVVEGFLAKGADDSVRARLSWLDWNAGWGRGKRGWGWLWRASGDGPDGTFNPFQRGRVRCEIWQRQDGGDDGDSTYVPDPFYEEIIACWRHDRDLVPSDTLQPDAG